jgi:hypothetical protein
MSPEVERLFILHIKDKDGRVIDVSPYYTNSLLSAALVGHVFQAQDGWTVTISDNRGNPPEEYIIDERGKPMPASVLAR